MGLVDWMVRLGLKSWEEWEAWEAWVSGGWDQEGIIEISVIVIVWNLIVFIKYLWIITIYNMSILILILLCSCLQ